MMRAALILTAVVALSACGETPQANMGAKSDKAAYQGTTNPFNAPGWKAGDKTAWELHLKTRLQNGQNEYNRIN
jgi:major membrane immunogen (membrane-anchored lipoprotein)